MVRVACCLLLTLWTGSCATPTAAWGPEGHRIVGEIASRHLTPAARRAVRDLLADGPSGYTTLAEGTTWPDRVARSDPRYAEWAGPLHYVNLGGATDPRAMLAGCLEGRGCVVPGIAYYAMLLDSPSATRQARREALWFLGHLVADAHQPLHATATGRGGNTIEALVLPDRRNGRETRPNLHQVWDTILIERFDEPWRATAKRLAAVPASERRVLQATSAFEWIEESRRLAEEVVLARASGAPIRSGDRLGPDYLERAAPVVARQLQRAGIRLAGLLNDRLDRDGAPERPMR